MDGVFSWLVCDPIHDLLRSKNSREFVKRSVSKESKPKAYFLL